MINASIDLYETTFDIKYLKRAIDWSKILIQEFWDNKNGGFYFTSSQSEKLITRQKEIYDGAIPSGNSIGFLNLIRLSHLTGNSEYEQTASKLLGYFSGSLVKSPSVFSQSLTALDFYFGPSEEIVISAQQIDDNTRLAINYLRELFKPNKVVVLNLQNKSDDTNKIVPFTSEMKLMNHKTTFYVCRNFACHNPVNSLKELQNLVSD
jgi:uncharacterized protein YyaL (SSP411 family)